MPLPQSYVVTATQQGPNYFLGMALTVKVLTGAAATQNGAIAASASANPGELSITPHATGSIVYGVTDNQVNDTTFTPAATTTYSLNFGDVINGAAYGTLRSTATTTASTPVTLGATAPALAVHIALAEILAAAGQTLAEDPSSPASVTTSTAETVSTAAFTPPPGSLLVAMVPSNFAGGTNPVLVTDTNGLTWTQLEADTAGIASVWVARVPLAQAGIKYRSAPQAYQSAGTVTTYSVPKTPGTQPGDWIFIFLFGTNATAACSGFTAKNDSGPYGVLFYRQADGTEAASFSITGLGGERVSAIIATVSGATPDPAAIATPTAAGPATTIGVASITLLNSADWVLWFAGNQDGFNSPSFAITPPAGYTSQVSIGSSATFPAIMLADNENASSGATGTQTGTNGGNTSFWSGVMVGLFALVTPAYPDVAAGVDAFNVRQGPGGQDVAAETESLAVAQHYFLTPAEIAAVRDGLAVVKYPQSGPVPASSTSLPPPLVFVTSQMPRMHIMDVTTNKWIHRDVQGITSPLITWNLNSADTFTCTVGLPRPDLLDATGNPVLNEWQHACFLEESGQIKFGGILSSSVFSGPQWQQTWQGYAGYPTGMPYEGPAYSQTNIEALAVVRYIWSWLQGQPNQNLNLAIDQTSATGVLLGAQAPAVAMSTSPGAIPVNARTFPIVPIPAGQPTFAVGDKITVGQGALLENRTIQATDGTSTITVIQALHVKHFGGAPIVQLPNPAPFVLDSWNSTDCGQEITAIQQEAVFDWQESHAWQDTAKSGVVHNLSFGVPRIGKRQSTLRFAEGENMVVAGNVTRDGTLFASTVVGLGAGQGSAQISSTVATVAPNRLGRTFVYTDQTVTTQARMSSKATKVLAAMANITVPSTVVVRNHPNAAFGTFGVGDDILITLCTGWFNQQIWCRITSMAQDPTSSLMTLTLARSDSYSYLAQSGQAGTL